MKRNIHSLLLWVNKTGSKIRKKVLWQLFLFWHYPFFFFALKKNLNFYPPRFYLWIANDLFQEFRVFFFIFFYFLYSLYLKTWHVVNGISWKIRFLFVTYFICEFSASINAGLSFARYFNREYTQFDKQDDCFFKNKYSLLVSWRECNVSIQTLYNSITELWKKKPSKIIFGILNKYI